MAAGHPGFEVGVEGEEVPHVVEALLRTLARLCGVGARGDKGVHHINFQLLCESAGDDAALVVTALYLFVAMHGYGHDDLDTVEEAAGAHFSSLVEETLSAEGEETGIQVYIGSETPIRSMQDCSVVTATYELGDGMKGTVGIIGPKRMDYDKVISTLKTMRHALDDLYKKE